MKILRVKCNSEGIEKASKVIKSGGIVVFPTDTVYGIGCDPFNEKAVEKIFKIKSRDKTKSLPVLVYSMDIASTIAEFDVDSEKLAKKFWPGPLTLILKLKDKKLKKSLRLEKKIALRVPDNNCTLNLLKICRFLIGTSANISTMKSITDPNQFHDDALQYDILIDDGKIFSQGESTVIEFQEKELKIHRDGIISKREILEVL